MENRFLVFPSRCVSRLIREAHFKQSVGIDQLLLCELGDEKRKTWHNYCICGKLMPNANPTIVQKIMQDRQSNTDQDVHPERLYWTQGHCEARGGDTAGVTRQAKSQATRTGPDGKTVYYSGCAQRWTNDIDFT